MTKHPDDLFDSIMFRDTPGAPLSYDEDDAFSVMLSPKQNTKLVHGQVLLQSSPPLQNSEVKSKKSRSSTKGRNMDDLNLSVSKPGSSAFSVLPPKVVVSLVIHEEATSMQEKKNDLDDIVSHVKIEGTAYAQLVSSNAGENPPFQVKIFDPDYPSDDKFVLNKRFIVEEKDGIKTLVVPKKVVEQIQFASWNRTIVKRFMPVLLQSKVVRIGTSRSRCSVAIQLRSNLNNKGSLKSITINVAVPPSVISASLKVKQGEGTYDALKRVITWNLKELPVGKSLMLGFEVDILPNLHTDELPKFPILIRCRSTEDTISSVNVHLEKLKGHPATLVVTTFASFRLLHRLPC